MKTLFRMVPAALLFTTQMAKALDLQVWSGYDFLSWEVNWSPDFPVDPSKRTATWTGLLLGYEVGNNHSGYRAGVAVRDTDGAISIELLGLRDGPSSHSVEFYTNDDPAPDHRFNRRYYDRLGMTTLPGMWVLWENEYGAAFTLPLGTDIPNYGVDGASPSWTGEYPCFCVPETGSVLLPAGACLGSLLWLRRRTLHCHGTTKAKTT